MTDLRFARTIYKNSKNPYTMYTVLVHRMCSLPPKGAEHLLVNSMITITRVLKPHTLYIVL
jgi:hypothetical protein